MMKGPAPIAQPAPGYEDVSAPPAHFRGSVIPSAAEERNIRRANSSEQFLLDLFKKQLHIDIQPLRRASKSTNEELKEQAKQLMNEVLSLGVQVDTFRATLDAYTLAELLEQHEQTRLQCREAKAAFEQVGPELNRAKQYAHNSDQKVQTLAHAINLIKGNKPKPMDFPSKEEIQEHTQLVEEAKKALASAKEALEHWNNEVTSASNRRFHLAQRYNDLIAEFKMQRKHIAALKGEPLIVGKESSFKSNEFGLN